jgi:tetratricopeptide (TPR) repeat protein
LESNAPTQRRFGALCVLACLAAAAFVLAVSWIKIESLDTGYHLAYGGYFLDHHAIVDRDPFLYPENAIPFVNANWASQIVMAAAYRVAGEAGLALLRTALIAAFFFCIALVLRRYSTRLEWLAAAWLLAAIAAYERFSLRPELFGYAAMMVMLVLLHRGMRTHRAVAAMAVVQLAWVNLHSYFLLGLFLTGAFVAGAAIDFLRCRDEASRLAMRRLAVTLALQVGVCFINPWTWRGALFPLQTLSYLSRENVMGAGPNQTTANAWSLISEFHSPFRYIGEPISGRTIDAYWVLLAVSLVGLVCLGIQGRYGPAILILILAAMSFQMRRNIAQFALAAAPMAVGALAVAVAIWARSVLGDRAARFAFAAACSFLAVWWTVGVVTGKFYYQERRITREFGDGLSQRTFPAAALDWLDTHPQLQPQLFVDYFTSSNTLAWLPPRFKLFVDTNTFAYTKETLAAAFDVGLGKVDHNALFDRYKVNVALLHCGPDTQALVRRLVADYTNWALVYVDFHAVIFARRIPEHVPIIRQAPPSAEGLAHGIWTVGHGEPAYTRAVSLCTAANVPVCLGWYAVAAEMLSEAVRLAPDYYDAWCTLGVCRANLGNAAARAGKRADARASYEAALDCARRALSFAPSYAPAQALRHDMEQVLKGLGNR